MIELPGLWSLSPFAAIIGMLVTFFLLLARGSLYTKGQHQEIVDLHEKRNQVSQDAAKSWEETAKQALTDLSTAVETNTIVGDFFSKAQTKVTPKPGGSGVEDYG